MKKQIENAIEIVKQRDINACITGSCLLDYFEGQDVDVFVYDEKSLSAILYFMEYNPMFQCLDPLELWKLNQYLKIEKNFVKRDLITIKYKYNLCIDVNICYRPTNKNVFTVISNFDLNIICKGFDLQTGKMLDLSDYTGDKIVKINEWNRDYFDFNLWNSNRLLRQSIRGFKYFLRGYNVDSVIITYNNLIDEILAFENIFTSDKVEEKLNHNIPILKMIKDTNEEFLNDHKMTQENLDVLTKTILTLK